MSGTDPLTGARFPTTGDAAAIAQYIQNLANDLSPISLPSFATNSARDVAYSNWVAAGNTMRDGLKCVVNGVPQRRINGAWYVDQPRIIIRTANITGGSGAILAGGSAETGVTSGITMNGGNNFTLYEAATVSINAAFRAGGAGGGALCYVKIDGTTVTNVATSRTDGTVPALGGLALNAGSHSISMRVDANSATQTWVDGIVILTVGTAE
jgi:hypothetical protein